MARPDFLPPRPDITQPVKPKDIVTSDWPGFIGLLRRKPQAIHGKDQVLADTVNLKTFSSDPEEPYPHRTFPLTGEGYAENGGRLSISTRHTTAEQIAILLATEGSGSTPKKITWQRFENSFAPIRRVDMIIPYDDRVEHLILEAVRETTHADPGLSLREIGEQLAKEVDPRSGQGQG